MLDKDDAAFYKAAKRQWNFAINGSSTALRSWAAVAILSLAIALMALWFAFSHMEEPKYIPYVVQFDSTNGKLDFKGFVQRANVELTQEMYRYTLIRFLSDLRMISSDNVVNNTNLRDSFYLGTSNCQQQLREVIGKSDPFGKSNKGIRIDIRWVVFEKMAENTWHVLWDEDTRQSGVLLSTLRFSGTFTFIKNLPSDPLVAERNPLGLYISEFFITPLRVNN